MSAEDFQLIDDQKIDDFIITTRLYKNLSSIWS